MSPKFYSYPIPENRPAFVDPYQPPEGQQNRPPIYRGELEAYIEQGRVPAAAAGASAVGAAGQTATWLAIACLGLSAVLWLVGLGLFALLVAWLFHAAAKTAFVKGLAESVFNLSVPMIALAMVLFLVKLGNDPLGGSLISSLNVLVFLLLCGGGVLAWFGRHVPIPAMIKALKS